MAPAGCSTLYVLEPAPNLNGKINWSTEAKPLRDRMHTFLAQQRYPTDVITEELVTPSTGKLRDGCRHPVRARPHVRADRTVPSAERRAAAGMFFAGSGTVPGVGVPMVLISGKLAANRVAAYLQEPGQ